MTDISFKPPPQQSASLVQRLCELFSLFHTCFKVFPKSDRFLGQKVETVILEILELLLSASYSDRQTKHILLKKASEKVDLLKYLIRIAFEIKALNLKMYINLEENILIIGKMLGGWIRSN